MPANTLYYFAVGGTGALSVEPLLHLCAAGLGPDRLAIVLIDPDAGSPALSRALELVESYQAARAVAGEKSVLFRTKLIRTDKAESVWSPLSGDGGGGIGQQTLEGYVEKARMEGSCAPAGELLDLLFSRQQQIEQLREGFRGNPAIGSILMHALRDSRVFRELLSSAKADPDGRFFAAGSIFGGTGASALPVLAKILADAGIGPERIGGALVTPYYALGVPSTEEERDGRLKPESAKFMSATTAALPTYTAKQTRYRSLYVVGDDQSLPHPRKTYSAGGSGQLNDPHYVELYAAMAALDFARTSAPPPDLEFRYATVGKDGPGWIDLPLDGREDLAAFTIASNFYLQYFGVTRSAADEERLEAELEKRPWAKDAGLPADFVRGRAAELNALGRYFAHVWGYLSAVSGNYQPLRLVSFETASGTTVPVPATYASRGQVVKLPRLEGMLRGYTGKHKRSFFRKGDPDQLGSLAEMFGWWNDLPKGEPQGVPGLVRYLAEGARAFMRGWYAPQQAADPNPRPLMHPLLNDLTRVTTGHWERVQNPSQLSDVKLIEATDRSKRPGISSIPSPWARLQVFRDAVADRRHPFHEEAVNDVLDALEVVLFQERLAGVKLTFETITIDSLLKSAKGEMRGGVVRFVDALQELAPEVAGIGLGEVTLVHNNGRPLFATSPFTVVFTPETRLPTIPGYFTGPRPIRTLAERPPMLAEYVRRELLPQIGASDVAGLPEMMALYNFLDDEANRGPAASDAAKAAAQGARFVQEKILPAPGIVLHRARLNAASSRIMLAPTRPQPQDRELPLVLDNSGNLAQRHFFSWLERPADARVEKHADRHILPGTSWQFDWVSPEHDFLADKLIVLDTPLHPERVRAGASQGAGSAAARVLVPLSSEFFKYFTPEDVPELLELSTSGSGGADLVVRVRLTVPTAGTGGQSRDRVTVEREYTAHQYVDAHLTLWPGFVTPERDWHDYYAVLYVDGQDVSQALSLTVSTGSGPIQPQRVQRDTSAAVYHFREPPECLYLRAVSRTVGDERQAQGVILPRLTETPAAVKPSWTVAIDFGTSNSVVAYSEPGQKESSPLKITKATRLDLADAPHAAEHIGMLLDTFFFPRDTDGKPFGTLMVRSRMQDVASALATTPVLTANVPFKGDTLAGAIGNYANDVVGDLKWDGGGDDSERLTKLFLHQILQVVHAEARALGVRTDKLVIRWSYPGAFSKKRRDDTATQWENILKEFCRDRLKQAAPEPDAGALKGRLSRLDESTAAMLYLQTDPAAGENFSEASRYLKLTADVGGGTTDVAGYANNGMVFRSSILFGGRNLVNEGEGNGQRTGIFARIFEWAQARKLPAMAASVIKAYPSNHTRFTYLVRHPWFGDNRGALCTAPWFAGVQACILYFYGAICYNIGLQLRRSVSGDVKAPDFLFVGGNGSSYLSWLTSFQPWNESASRGDFETALKHLLEAGFGQPLDKLGIFTSSRPKQEVARGLLEWTGAPMDATREAEVSVGEAVSVRGKDPSNRDEREATDILSAADLEYGGAPGVHYLRPWAEWEITRFHRAFAEQLSALGKSVDPQWRQMASRVQAACGAMDERFFDTPVSAALTQQLRKKSVSAVSYFTLEASAALRELERQLLADARS